MSENENDDVQINYEALRRQAEQRLVSYTPKQPIYEELQDAQRLLSELQVSQIELELQNDELRQVQASLSVEREKYADLYNFAPVAYFLFDKNDIILDLNLTATDLLGKERRYLINRPFTAYITPESLEIFIAHRNHVFETDTPQSCELHIKRSDQTFRIVQVRTIAIKNADGNSHIWRSVMTDITEQKEIHAALKRSQVLLIALSRGAQSALLATTRDEIYRAVGEQAEHLGSELGILEITDSDQLNLSYTTLGEKTLREIAKKFNQPLNHLSLPIIKDGLLASVIRNKKIYYSEDVQGIETLQGNSPAAVQTRFLVKLFKATQMIIAPLLVEDSVIGLLMVMSNSLDETDVTVFDIFAAQIAISLRNAKLLEELALAFSRQKELAQTDALTGVNNRRALFDNGQKMLSAAQRYERELSLIMLDIDHFKNVNDRFGHAVGDQVLQHVTQVIAGELREADFIGRYGGEEFVIVLPETEVGQACQLAERLRLMVEKAHLQDDAGEVSVTISLGVATLTPDIDNFDMLVNKVDQALYDAKRNGRNQLKVFTD